MILWLHPIAELPHPVVSCLHLLVLFLDEGAGQLIEIAELKGGGVGLQGDVLASLTLGQKGVSVREVLIGGDLEVHPAPVESAQRAGAFRRGAAEGLNPLLELGGKFTPLERKAGEEFYEVAEAYEIGGFVVAALGVAVGHE